MRMGDAPKLTNRMLTKAGRLAEEMQGVQQSLTEAFRHRYGVTYSDVDADEIIDVLDYQGGKLTVEDCDRIMTAAGYPPVANDRGTRS